MKYLTLTCFLLIYLITNAQTDFKFGKVSKEEVEQTQHALEKDAEAAILYKKETVHYDYNSANGFLTKRYAHYRIKIYDKSGLDWGTFNVPLYKSGSNEESISSVKGYTYNLENGKVVETKLDKSSVFKESVNKYRNKASIVMPEVKEGSVLDIEFVITSDFAGNLNDFQIQYGIPVNIVDVKVKIPQYFVFKRYGKGFYPINLVQSKENRKINYQYRDVKTTSARYSAYNNLTRGTSVTREGTLNFTENIYTIKSGNVPSLKEEDFTDNIDNYRAAIKFELASIQFPNEPFKNYSFTWEDVAKTIYQYPSFGAELGRVKLFKDEVETLKNASSGNTELQRAIFEHVKNHMSWNDYNGVGCEKGLKKAYSEQTGNVADINLMLVNMLRAAGFEANPVLVSTKSHGVPLFPTTDGFNYVVAAVEDNGQVLLMDATEKMGQMGVLPARVLNWKGRLVRTDGTSMEISMHPNKPAQNITFVSANILADGTLEGKTRKQLSANNALTFRKKYKDDSVEDIMDKLEEGKVDFEVNELDVKNKIDCTKPIVEVFAFTKENQTEIISDKVYFKPTFFWSQSDNPFKQDKREYPVDFVYPQLDKMTINLNIPEGYTIESLPESIAIGLPDNLGSFQYSLKQSGNSIQVLCTTSINSAIIPAYYYDSLKEFYNQMVNKLNERVVLVKA